MGLNIESVIGDWPQFLGAIFTGFLAQNQDVSQLYLDHICYRTTTLASYETKKSELAHLGRLLTEEEIGGRPIATYFLHHPLIYNDRKINVVELPSPKQGTAYSEGLEHVEFVRADPEETRVHLGPYTAKFHSRSLFDLIQDERLEAALKFPVKEPARSVANKLMQPLEAFEPVLVGTFPLDLDIEGSDLDIICQANDLQSFLDFAEPIFKHEQQFRWWKGNKNGADFIVLSFMREGFPVEIFATSAPVKEQNGYKHMLAEARLLALVGEWAREELRQLKRQGLKTEPAFAKFFNLEGDPYIELYKLAEAPRHKLEELALMRLTQI